MTLGMYGSCRVLTWAMLCGLLPFVVRARAADLQTAEAATVTVKRGEGEYTVGMRYLLFLGPAAKGDVNAKVPLLLFLHGSGERGDDLEMVKRHGPPKLVESQPDFPFLVVSPQCPTGERWRSDELAVLVDYLTKKYPVDTNRLYVTGLSMGGSGTWNLVSAYPRKFAAAAPICGRADLETVAALKALPLWVFLGAKDKAELVENNCDVVAALQRAGSRVQFTLYPEAGHDSWTESYANPKLWSWMLEQKRAP